MTWLRTTGAAGALAVFLCAGSAGAQVNPGDLLVSVIDIGTQQGAIYRINGGGNFAAATPFITMPAGVVAYDMCRRPDGTIFVVSANINANNGGVSIINSGSLVTFATGFTTPVPIDCAANGSVMVGDALGSVYDITAGGDFSAATPFASGFTTVGMHRSPNGFFATDYDVFGTMMGPFGVHNITAGGDFSMTAHIATSLDGQAAATAFFGGQDLVSVLSTGLVHVITPGTSVNASPIFASVPSVGGIWNDQGTLWASSFDGRVYDISAGGTFTTAQAFATGQPNWFIYGLVGVPNVLPNCGNGVTDPGEDCDDMGESAMCDADCTFVSCGDFTLNMTAGEMCDSGGVNSATCDADCTLPLCGDGTTNMPAGETCDDMGESLTCDVDCTAVLCGDNVTNMTAGEACDTGGINTMTCDADCSAVMCGDGNANLAAGEQCDDGGESATCDSDCTTAVCGDGTQNATAGETCDDGNVVDGDGCDAMCQVEMGMGGMGGAGGAGTGGAGGVGTGGVGPGSGGMASGGDATGGTGGAGTGGAGTGGGNEGGSSEQPFDTKVDAGCGCELPGERRRDDGVWLCALGVMLMLRRRRRP